MEMPEQDRKTARAADAIVAAVEARIASGGLKDGAPLPAERALMEEFGASRTVVREAITALSNRGLIDARPRFRPVVRRIGYQSVIDATSPVIRRLLSEKDGVRNLYKTRVFVERLLVRDAALDADADWSPDGRAIVFTLWELRGRRSSKNSSVSAASRPRSGITCRS